MITIIRTTGITFIYLDGANEEEKVLIGSGENDNTALRESRSYLESALQELNNRLG